MKNIEFIHRIFSHVRDIPISVFWRGKILWYFVIEEKIVLWR